MSSMDTCGKPTTIPMHDKVCPLCDGAGTGNGRNALAWQVSSGIRHANPSHPLARTRARTHTSREGVRDGFI